MVMKEELYWQTTQIYSTKTWPFMEQMNTVRPWKCLPPSVVQFFFFTFSCQIITHVAQSGLAQYWEYNVSHKAKCVGLE